MIGSRGWTTASTATRRANQDRTDRKKRGPSRDIHASSPRPFGVFACDDSHPLAAPAGANVASTLGAASHVPSNTTSPPSHSHPISVACAESVPP